MIRPAATAALGLAAFVAAVVLLWPGPGEGPEPVAWGRDVCDECRMHLTRPGFAGELRDHTGTLRRYDDVGCLLRAMLASHREMPEAWVEDHGAGGFVPLLRAHLVRAEAAGTPMGYGVVAFRDEAAAAEFAAVRRGRLVSLEELVRPGALVARPPHGPEGGEP